MSLFLCMVLAGGFFTTSTTWGTSYTVAWLQNCRGLKIQRFFFLLTLQVHQRLDRGSASSFSSCGPQDDKASALCTLLVKWQKKKRRWQSLCGLFQLPLSIYLLLLLLPPWPIIQGTGQSRHQGLGMPTYPTSGGRGRTEEFLKSLVTMPLPYSQPSSY